MGNSYYGTRGSVANALTNDGKTTLVPGMTQFTFVQFKMVHDNAVDFGQAAEVAVNIAKIVKCAQGGGA